MEQLTNLVISDRELAFISAALNKLMNDTNATSVMLIDKSGQVIATQGTGVRRNATSLGALLAGAFSSSRHIAELLGEKDFRTIFQQGVHENIYTTMVEDQWLLVIVFDKLTQMPVVICSRLRPRRSARFSSTFCRSTWVPYMVSAHASTSIPFLARFSMSAHV